MKEILNCLWCLDFLYHYIQWRSVDPAHDGSQTTGGVKALGLNYRECECIIGPLNRFSPFPFSAPLYPLIYPALSPSNVWGKGQVPPLYPVSHV